MVEFDQMDEEAKQNVREWVTAGDDWHLQEVVKDWKERLEELGFWRPHIIYDLSGCQGSGVSFTCREIDNEKMLTAIMYCGASFEDVSKFMIILELPGNDALAELLEIERDEDLEFEFSIYRNSDHYAHKRTVKVEMERSPDLFYDLATEFAQWIDEYRIDLCDQIEKDLESERDYHNSDEAIKEVIWANDWKFDEDGTFIC